MTNEDAGENIFRFAERQAEGGLEQAIASFVVQLEFDLSEAAHFFGDFFEEVREFLHARQGEVQDGDFLLELGWDFQYRGDNHDRFEAVLQVKGDLLEFSNDGVVPFGKEWVKILEKENSRLDLLDDLLERGEGLAGRGIAGFLRLD